LVMACYKCWFSAFQLFFNENLYMVKKIIVPKTWRPECTHTINKWFDKIHKEVNEKKGLIEYN